MEVKLAGALHRRLQGGAMGQIKRWSALFLVILLLPACGGGGHAGSGAAATPARGTLLQIPPHLVSTIPAPTLLLQLGAATNQQLLSLSGAPLCDILIYDIQYETVGGANEATTASGALLVPTGPSACTGACSATASTSSW